MKIKGVTVEDFANYKVPSMFIAMPTCNWKCCPKDPSICQNSDLALAETKDVSNEFLINLYKNNPICKAVVFGGLEPFDSFDEMLTFILEFRKHYQDDIVIYTGYYIDEIEEYIDKMYDTPNIIIKCGRYIPNQKPHFSKILGVNLASDNQYAFRIEELYNIKNFIMEDYNGNRL